MARTGRPIKDFEAKAHAVEENGFPRSDVFPWWRKFHQLQQGCRRRDGIENELTFADYMQKVREAGMNSPADIGTARGKFQLGRVGDSGNYTVDGCRFVTREVNTSEAYANGRYENKKRITAQVLRERFTGQTKYSSDHCQAVSEAHSKAFTVTSPAGVTYVGKNLKEFCRDFDLNGGTMGQVLLGKARAHKGWTGAYDDAPEELIGIAGLGFPSPVVLF